MRTIQREAQRVHLTPRSPVVSVRLTAPELLSEIALRLRRSHGGTVRTQLIYEIDGEPHVAMGRSSRSGIYRMRYRPTYWMEPPRGHDWQRCALHRIGELARRRRQAWVRLELLAGSSFDALLDVWLRAAPGGMQLAHNSIGFDAATDAKEEAGDGVLSLSHTATGSNRAAFAGMGVHHTGGRTSTSITYNAAGMTEQWDVTGTNISNSGYTLVAPDTGAQTVTGTVSGSVDGTHFLGVITLTGVDQTTPIGTPASATGTSTTATVTVGSVGATDLVVDSVILLPDVTIGADQTLQNTESGTAGTEFRQSTQPGTAGGVMSWTQTSADPWAIGAIAFKAAATSPTIAVPVGAVAFTGRAPTRTVAGPPVNDAKIVIRKS